MQLIFNKVSGGGEKVKINGLPPTERLNLKEVTNSVVFSDYQLNDSNFRSIFEENGILYYSSDKAVYKFDRKNFTKIGDCGKVRDAIKDGDSLILMTEAYHNYFIYKIENGLTTRLGITEPAYGEIASTYCHFFLGNTVYFRNGSEPYRVYKSDNFGKTWTDITGQIVLKDGLDLSHFEFWEGKEQFNYGNCKYAFFQTWAKPPKRIKFDGKTFSKIDLKIEDSSGFVFNSEDNRSNRDKILALKRKNTSGFEDELSLYNIKVINNTIEFELIKKASFREGLFNGTRLLDAKNETLTSLASNQTDKCIFTEFFKKTYIPE